MNFIHYQDAWQLLFDSVPEKQAVKKNLPDTLGHYTSEDIYAPVDIPLFDNSAMDGFGFINQNLSPDTFYPIVGESKAGSSSLPVCLPGQAIRIFTGAPVPEQIDLVVMKEQCDVQENMVRIMHESWSPGMNIRPKGSQTQKGSLILPAKTKMTPGIIGFLAGFGLEKISVFPFPEIGILITGDELVPPGKTPEFGKIYESNGTALTALLAEIRLNPVFVKKVPDVPEVLNKEIKAALLSCDILILTGGISVGDYDFVQDALVKNNVQKQFYKIRQKPGKPIFFGKKEDVSVFALPGNPASVFTCFEVYVRPFIEAFISGKTKYIHIETAKMAHDFSKKKGLTHFFKSVVSEGQLTMLTGQESYKMDAFTTANALVILEEDSENIYEGEFVKYIKI
ncbi:MAG: molybdopterin molybdotransferase MoeA [Saprospiraceae bacterium]|nr:molybdopterin molybdotransferase MoeA [Saprospiraceae bacterium]